MRIEEYLASSGKPLGQALEEASKETGYSVMAFRYWISGKRIPRRETMEKLEKWSGGAITPSDWYSSPGKAA